MSDNTVALMQLAAGVSIYDLHVLTRKSEAEVKAALSDVAPSRGGNARTYVYDLTLALAAIYANDSLTTDRIEQAMRTMKPGQLPAGLQKEFWAAQSERVKYLENRGELWRTYRVQQMFAQVLKVMRQAITLMEDNVDQQSTLSVRQREIVRGIADTVLRETQALLREAFEGWPNAELDRELEQ